MLAAGATAAAHAFVVAVVAIPKVMQLHLHEGNNIFAVLTFVSIVGHSCRQQAAAA